MSKTVLELKQVCKENGIRGYSKLKKVELIKLCKPSIPNISKMIKHVQNTPESVVDLCQQLYESYKNQPNKKLKRLIQYDAHFIACIAIIGGLDTPILFGSKNINNTQFDPKSEFGVKKMNFFLEDIFTLTPKELYKECGVLDKTGKSYLFKSNIVNFMLMLMCYSTHCFDKYFDRYKSSKSGEININTIFKGYKTSMENMVNGVIVAYTTCSYESLKNIYTLYLKFYTKYMYKFLRSFDIGVEDLDIVRDMKNDWVYIYLSFNLQPETIMAPLLPTKFAVAHIGFRPAHDYLYDSIDVITHDMYFHGVITRIKNLQPYIKRLRKFIIDLYNSSTENYKVGCIIYWSIQNENYKKMAMPLNDMIAIFTDTIHQSAQSIYTVFYKHGDIDYLAIETIEREGIITLKQLSTFFKFLLKHCRDVMTPLQETLLKRFTIIY